MKLQKHSTFYCDAYNRKHFCTWVQHNEEVFDIKDILVHE